MNNIKKYFLVMAVLLLAFAKATAADEKDIIVLCFNHGDSVSLRWAPSSEALFHQSVKSGYIVQRREAGAAQWTNISPKLYPASEKDLESMEVVIPDAASVREILYPSNDRNARAEDDSSNDPNGPQLSSVPGQPKIEDELLLMMALFSCDISIDVAKAAALHFVDKQVDRKATYEYRVIFADQEKSKKVNVSSATVQMSVKTVLPTPDDFEGSFEENFAHFQWSVANFDGYYSAYNVERSMDGVHFAQVRERPIVQAFTNEKIADVAVFRDTFPIKEDVTYYYRMAGYSPFGFYGPYSKVVKGEPKFNFDAIPISIDTIVLGKKNVEIRWNFDKKHEKRIKGFRISRTPDYKSFTYENEGFIPANKRSFKINKTFSRSQYYAVIAYGKQERQEKQSSYYFDFHSDTIPPATPTGLKAVIDSTGLTTITWNPNTEPDILGYQLFISNSGNEMEYFNVTDTIYPFTTYTDTLSLNTLTNSAYYRVNAIDKSYNRSHWSDAVKVIKPDTIPPVPVRFHMLQQPKEKMVIEWDNSPSLDLDYMELYRQIDDTGKLMLVKRFDLKKKKIPSSYEDDYEYSGQQISYSMIVYDEAGNKAFSNSNVLTAKGERPGCIANLQTKLLVTEDKKQIELQWQVITDVPIYRFVIYRQKDDEAMYAIDMARSENYTYVDEKITIGSVYKYIVRAMSTERTCPALYSDPIEFVGNRSHK